MNKNLSIDSISIHKNEYYPNGIISIEWSSDKGFGEYQLSIDQSSKSFDDIRYDNPNKSIDEVIKIHHDQDDIELKLSGYSENMDSNDNKEFIKNLLLSIVDKIDIKD